MPFLHRLKSRLAGAVPALTMLGTFGLAGAVHYGSEAHEGLVGFAQGVPEALAALEPARITALHVAIGAEVEPNQLVATLDTSTVDGEIAIAEAERGRLEAALRAEQTTLGRRLDVDRETIEREATREREDLLELRAESEALDGEMARVTLLVAEHQAVLSDLTPMKLRHAQLASLADEKPRLIGLIGKQLAAANRRRQEVDDDHSTAAANLDAELLVVQRRIELLEKRRASHLLRATRKGRVVALEKQPGETANAGESVVKLVSAANRIIVCGPERQALAVREGDVAHLRPRGQRGAPLPGRVVALGAVVAELPPRCWATPRLPIWGRELTVSLDTPIDAVTGEAFIVSFDATFAVPAGGTAGVPVAKARGQSTPDPDPTSEPARVEPRFIVVPPSLARRTRFEPSGILVRPGERRYLVVSDDTGLKDGPDEGRPWLFSMDASGVVDPSPVAIAGVRSIDDLESITEGDSGEIYVLSSQSYSKQGRRKGARSALLRLRADGGKLRADGEVHLAEMLDLATDRAAALGLANGTRSLDIEGMTFHAGALYLGVKAPLDAQGEAMVWKISAPKALFDAPHGGAKTLEASGIAAWAHGRVDVELDGKAVPGGISELLFLDDESLVVASTPSTAERAAGALWHVEPAQAKRGGAIVPRLVRRFPGLKPEGLTPSLSRDKLIVVFDAGSATPSFLEMPWPR